MGWVGLVWVGVGWIVLENLARGTYCSLVWSLNSALIPHLVSKIIIYKNVSRRGGYASKGYMSCVGTVELWWIMTMITHSSGIGRRRG